jgi:hypothetical protein
MCDRTVRQCTEATAVIANDLMLPIDINVLEVTRWDAQFIIIRGPSALCVEETYTADIGAETLTGVVTRKAGCEDFGRKSVRIRLIDGYDASKTLRRSGP